MRTTPSSAAISLSDATSISVRILPVLWHVCSPLLTEQATKESGRSHPARRAIKHTAKPIEGSSPSPCNRVPGWRQMTQTRRERIARNLHYMEEHNRELGSTDFDRRSGTCENSIGCEPDVCADRHTKCRESTVRTNRTRICMQRIALLILFSAATASAVSAQVSQGANPNLEAVLTPGTIVWITDSQGREDKVRIVSASGDIVTTTTGNETRRLRTADVMRVKVRQRDSVLNGALIGAGAAVASGLLFCSLMESWENCRDDVGPMLAIGAIGAGAGIGIDALIRGRRTIYEAAGPSTQLQVAPIIARHARGLQVSLRF